MGLDRNELAARFAVAAYGALLTTAPKVVIAYDVVANNASLQADALLSRLAATAPAAKPAERPEWVRITASGFMSPLVRRVIQWNDGAPSVGTVSTPDGVVRTNCPTTLGVAEWEPCYAPSSPSSPASPDDEPSPGVVDAVAAELRRQQYGSLGPSVPFAGAADDTKAHWRNCARAAIRAYEAARKAMR